MKTTSTIFVPKRSHIACLDDYRPVALTPVITQCLERLILAHISDCLPPSFNPHQFAYKANRSTEDSIFIIIHTVLSHLEHRDRVLFVDFSSACNTIIPNVLVRKLSTLGLHPLTCLWIKDFLTDKPQTVKLGLHLSSTHTLSTGSPQGCVLCPLLFTLYTANCRPVNANNTIAKFADDTTVVGSIAGRDESAYRDEVLNLSTWCQAHNLILNTRKTKEIILDFRRQTSDPLPLFINGKCVERVHSFTLLGTTISFDLSWGEKTTAVIKKAQQCLHFV